HLEEVRRSGTCRSARAPRLARRARAAIPPLADLRAPAVGAKRDEEDALFLLDDVLSGDLRRDPPARDYAAVGRDRAARGANPRAPTARDTLRGGRPLRACADLGVPAQRVAPGPPLVHGVLREERDEGVELVPFPSAAIRVEPAIQLLERHGRQPSEPALTLRPRNAEKRKMSPRSFRSLA